jgi:hypothetical protein
MSRLPHFLYNRLTDGDEVVSLMRRPPFAPQEDSWYSLLLGWVYSTAIMRREGLGQLKKSNDPIGIWNLDLPACSIGIRHTYEGIFFFCCVESVSGPLILRCLQCHWSLYCLWQQICGPFQLHYRLKHITEICLNTGHVSFLSPSIHMSH